MFWKKKTASTQGLDSVLIEALRTVDDPELHKDLVTLGMVKRAILKDGAADITIELTTPACPLKDTIRRDIEAAVNAVAPGTTVAIEWTAQVRSGPRSTDKGGGLPSLSKVANIVLVASGKGGVGKSTVATNLAAALTRLGAKVGLLDADIYGPSIPTMFGLHKGLESRDGKRIDPHIVAGLKLVSMGFLIPPEKAMIWRGPMLHSAVLQFVRDVAWGELDYLIVDLPPGTGDVQLTFAQQVPVTGAVIVSTPQAVALADVVRAQAMFESVDIPILGLVENMSYFVCDGCDKRHAIFDTGGARRAAEHFKLDFLAEIPIDMAIRAAGDSGMPIVQSEPDSTAGRAYVDLARRVAGRVSVVNAEAAEAALAAAPSPQAGRRLPIIS
jgi:ATP-binding protein involved in chromosome partitioning